jgi:hypothetical protein
VEITARVWIQRFARLWRQHHIERA